MTIKTALITGGASGLGYEFATLLAKDAYHLILIDIDSEKLKETKKKLEDKYKTQVIKIIENIKKTQLEVLEQYSKMVKSGGKMVYATCSVLPSENQKQVDKFLTSEAGKEFTFVKDKKVLAYKSGFDGFYMALLERKN